MRERLYYLDWLRVIAILILHFYHSASIFTPPHFMIKNEALSPLLGEINQFFHEWRLALLFLISGAGTAFALGFRSAKAYTAERGKRLLIPLLFGVVVIIPPQVYIERLSQGFEFSSFLEFFRRLPASGLYPAGNISWHHLWFVGYLFIYSILALPLFIYWRSNKGQQKALRFTKKFNRPEHILLWAFPIILVTVFLTPYSTGVQNIVNDSAKFFSYFLFFIFGYLFHKGNLWEKLSHGRLFFLKAAFLCTIFLYYLHWTDNIPVIPLSTSYILYYCLKALNSWVWVITITGFSVRYLNIKSTWIMKVNKGIYPFYILHQTFIVIVAYYILPFNDSLFMKYTFISIFSLVLDIGMLLVFITPFKVTRFLFGMKRK
jgi:hypothetical protein